MVKTYFFDTYALFEVVAGNEEYFWIADGAGFLTTKLNLMELHYGLLKYGEEFADDAYDAFALFTMEFDDDAIKEANRLKAKLRKRKLSYVDCLGYVLARSRGIAFLTGDRQFQDLDGVEYVR
jgi:uncharacterized protein